MGLCSPMISPCPNFCKLQRCPCNLFRKISLVCIYINLKGTRDVSSQSVSFLTPLLDLRHFSLGSANLYRLILFFSQLFKEIQDLSLSFGPTNQNQVNFMLCQFEKSDNFSIFYFDNKFEYDVLLWNLSSNLQIRFGIFQSDRIWSISYLLTGLYIYIYSSC